LQWLDEYWSAHPKPWNRPGLSPGRKWRIRYENDGAFRKVEYARLQRNKRDRRNWITSYAGSMTPVEVRRLREAATHCAQCGIEFEYFRQTTIDHVQALSRGGMHVEENVRVVCLRCNSQKGARPMPGVVVEAFANHGSHC
jgi:5-methylcytosine-specific restriction endonuclease McrA